MQTRSLAFMLALTGLAASLTASSHAQNLYWDTSGTAGIQGGVGNWNSSSFWNPASDGSGTPQGWSDGADANFSGNSSTVDLEATTWNVGKLAWTGGITVILSNGGGLNLSGGIANANLNGSSTLTGPITLTGAQAFALSGSGISNLGGSLNVGAHALAINATGNNRVNISAALTGSGDITVSSDNAIGVANNGNRLVQFTGSNSGFTGDYILNKGVMGIYSVGSGYTKNSVLQFGNTADNKEFNMLADSVTFGGLNSNGGAGAEYVSLGSHSSRNLTIDTSVTGGGFDFAGTIRQLDATKILSVTKTGSGVQTLSGNNSYAGTTAVNAGGLIVDGLHTGAGNYTVAANAWLGGNGTIATTGTVTFAESAKLVFNPLETLDIEGAVSLHSTFSIGSLVNANGSAMDWDAISAGSYVLIGSTTSDFSGIGNFGSENAADIGNGRSAYFSNGSLTLTVVPEPGTLGLLAFGGFAMLALRRLGGLRRG